MIRCRFAPSPTGEVHIGNIRTAIFNYLFARHEGGEFLLRVEDTDRERSTKEAVGKLFDAMEWMGLENDGEAYWQSQHSAEHAVAAERLLDEGAAYRPDPKAPGEPVPVVFRIPWDTDGHPNVSIVGETKIAVHPAQPVSIAHSGISFSQISRKGKPMPAAACLAGFHGLRALDSDGAVIFELEDELDEITSSGRKVELRGVSEFVFQRREVFFDDIVKGRLSKPLDAVKDLVIVRSDGSPVFHLANVLDDAAQRVTHVVRGDDHVENTFRHVLLFRALGVSPPRFAHLPMIVNKQGKPYSKRDGDAFVGEFREKGFLPEALFNHLALLGWSPGDGREMLSKKELVEAFALERALSSPARFDMAKLANLNGRYVAALSDAEFADKTVEFAEFTGRGDVLGWRSENPEKFAEVASLAKNRTKILTEIDSWRSFFEDVVEFDAGIAERVLKSEHMPALSTFANMLDSLDNPLPETIVAALRAAESKHGLEEGKLNRPARFAATNSGSGPDLDKTLLAMGPRRAAANIKKALACFRDALGATDEQ